MGQLKNTICKTSTHWVISGLLAVALLAGKIQAQTNDTSVGHNTGVTSPETSSVAPPSLSGKWSGSWSSETTGHRGSLKADIRPNADGSYSARFTGRFFRVIPFRYQMQLNVVGQDGNDLILAGSKKLGPVMGYYSYQAVVSGDQFSASYSTKKDRGSFFLRR
jgi:hypothetical protein